MLADDLIAARGSFNDRMYFGAFSRMADSIRGAHRFDLAPEVMRSAYAVTMSAIGPQLRALSLCRLPFARCWFEWPGGSTGIPSMRTDLYAPTPRRMGALIETDDTLQRGVMAFAWIHRERDLAGGANVCPLSIAFDWTDDPQPLPDVTRTARERWQAKADDQAWLTLAQKYPRVRASKREDVLAENLRFGVTVNPAMEKFLALAAGGSAFDKIMNAAIKDIEGEAPNLRSVLMLLNSRNLTHAEARPAPVKLNRSRAKSGKAALLDFTTITIRLSRGLAARAGGVDDPRSPSRLHLVRGHFKVRASGVYWWSPHARGDAQAGEVRQQVHKVKG